MTARIYEEKKGIEKGEFRKGQSMIVVKRATLGERKGPSVARREQGACGMRGKKGCFFFLVTFCLNLAKSAGVNVSALAITGIKFTREPRRFITSMSKGRNLIKRGK